MTGLALWTAYAIHWLVIAAWAACHWQISAARRRICGAGATGGRGDGPRVRVVLAAKDEAGNLEAAANAILAQAGVAPELVIVDDRSTDGTGPIADQIAGRDGRCRVIHICELPAGWMGKSHACARGAAGGEAEWLLFTDADVRLAPRAIAAAIEVAERERLSLFSLWPRDDSRGFWERLLVPLCGAMIVIWYGHVAARSNARGEAFANGQFLLIRRSAYELCGGHAAVKSALIEDIPLARRVAGCGLAVGSAPGPELAAVRMYRSAREVFAGWRRIFVGVLAPLQMVGCVLSLLVGSLFPIVLAPTLLGYIWLHGASAETLAWFGSGLTHLIVLASVSVRFFALARCDRRYLWLYPASVFGVLLILLSALWSRTFRRPIAWRGTPYAVGADGRIA